MMLRNLDRLARAQGGAVYMLNGNHESLNIAGDFRRESKQIHSQRFVPSLSHAHKPPSSQHSTHDHRSPVQHCYEAITKKTSHSAARLR